MRRILSALSVASLVLLITASAAFATHSVRSISVVCGTDQTTGVITVSGYVTITGGTAGETFQVVLEGRIGSSGYAVIGGTNPTYFDTITIVEGQTSYFYEIVVPATAVSTYDSFRVTTLGNGPESSRSFETDECLVLIDEAPLVILLVVTAGLAAAAFVWFQTRRQSAPQLAA